MDAAKLHGWMRVHLRPARTERGWRTAYEGDAGLPDLVLARGGRVLLAELKTATGCFRPGQREWLAAAGGCGHLWRPADWDGVLAVLAGGA
jgi:hypothetical protein